MGLEQLVGQEAVGRSGRAYDIVDFSAFHKAHAQNEAYIKRRLCSFHALSAGDRFFVKKMSKSSTEIMFFEHMKERNAFHPSIVTLVDIIDSEDSTLLVFPFTEYDCRASREEFRSTNIGDYTSALKKMWVADNDLNSYHPCMFFIAYYIMRILRHLHENDVIYCDLKPANILVQPRDDDLKLRFCDFEGVYFGKRDASGVLNAERNRVGTIKATPNYCPPELLYDKDITEKWDVYSYGCTMYMLYTENRPRQIKQELFSDRVIVHSKKERAQREKRFKDIEECENAGFLTSHDAMCSPDIPWYMKRVIADCLTHDPDIRPTSQEIEFKMKEVIERIYYKSRFEFYKTKAELAFLRNSLKILIPLEPYLQPLKLFMS